MKIKLIYQQISNIIFDTINLDPNIKITESSTVVDLMEQLEKNPETTRCFDLDDKAEEPKEQQKYYFYILKFNDLLHGSHYTCDKYMMNNGHLTMYNVNNLNRNESYNMMDIKYFFFTEREV